MRRLSVIRLRTMPRALRSRYRNKTVMGALPIRVTTWRLNRDAMRKLLKSRGDWDIFCARPYCESAQTAQPDAQPNAQTAQLGAQNAHPDAQTAQWCLGKVCRLFGSGSKSASFGRRYSSRRQVLR